MKHGQRTGRRGAVAGLGLVAVLALAAGRGAGEDTAAREAAQAAAALQGALQLVADQSFYEARITLETNLPEGLSPRTVLAEGRIQTPDRGHFTVYLGAPGDRDLEVYLRGRMRAARTTDGADWTTASGERGPGLLPFLRFPHEIWDLINNAGESCEAAGRSMLVGRECLAVQVVLKPDAVKEIVSAWQGKRQLDPGSAVAKVTVYVDKLRGIALGTILQVTATMVPDEGGSSGAALTYLQRTDFPLRSHQQPFVAPPEVERLLK